MASIKTIAIIIIILLYSEFLWADEKKLTIIHSNDLHSHFLGFSPNTDYTPDKIQDDTTIGGWARLATVINNVKKLRDNQVLVLDAGDFCMGSLFHMLCREEAFELNLMKGMGYEAVCLGNHEFDLKPKGLARILSSASKINMPSIILSNMVFSNTSNNDDTLEAAYNKGLIQQYTVINKEGLRIGLFGLIGKDAAEVAPFASPVSFSDPIKTANAMIRKLRDKEKVDIVIALSHCGLNSNLSKSEDQNIAKKTKGIDIIISGHTHTRVQKPILENGTIIVQAWEYGKSLGILDVIIQDGKVTLDKYEEAVIDDSIPGDPKVTNLINSYINSINGKVLNEYKLSFYEIIADSKFDLTIHQDESNLGNLITDSLRWYVNKVASNPKDPSTRVNVAVESYGLIRDSVLRGKTGKIAVCDLFNAFPLGIGWDDTMCYPVVSFYLNASEIKKTLEVLTSIYPLKGSDYFLQVSGIKFSYNPNRVIFDRVTDILMENDKGEYQPLDYSSSNKSLYRVAANIYNATFLKVIGSYTMNILNIIPKDKNGAPIDDLEKVIIDGNPGKEGLQELKEWLCMVRYVMSFPDTDGNGTPDIPESYRGKQGRILVEASMNPFSLLSRGSWLTWMVFAVILLAVSLTSLTVYKVVIKVRRKISHH